MQAEKITLDRKQARELYRQYKKHQHYSAPMDDEIRRAYQLIAQGRLVIRAVESVRAAGVYTEGPNAGLPKLALCRAHGKECWLEYWSDGSAAMTHLRWNGHNNRRDVVRFAAGAFPRRTSGIHRGWGSEAKATVPLIPVHLRPKRALANYHVLWEAEWTRVPPRDPMLLRRIGKGDMWLVVAAWDLTELERAALAARLSS